jgi:hypothetical protein
LRRQGLFPWLLLMIWGCWLLALQSSLVAAGVLGRWVPDLGLVLVLALAVRMRGARALAPALCIGLARCAYSIDAPAAILAAYLAAALLALALRSAFDLQEPIFAAALAGACALAGAQWLRWLRAGELPPLPAHARALLEDASAGAWPIACASALAALCAGRALAHLPGLPALWKARP